MGVVFEMLEELINRLLRYSEQCIAERLDPDYAEAIVDVIVYLRTIQAMENVNSACPCWVKESGICSLFGMPVEM